MIIVLIVNHFVGPSQIHGLGVFATEPIRAGQTVWEFNALIDRVISLEDLASLPQHTILQVLKHAEFRPRSQIFVLAADGDYYMNHADRPSLTDSRNVMYAARDIEAGEELTCDYRVVRVVAFSPDNGELHSLPQSWVDRVFDAATKTTPRLESLRHNRSARST